MMTVLAMVFVTLGSVNAYLIMSMQKTAHTMDLRDEL